MYDFRLIVLPREFSYAWIKWRCGMKTLLLYVAYYSFEACCVVLDVVWPVKKRQLSEHDRFADRAIYSEDPAIDPLA